MLFFPVFNGSFCSKLCSVQLRSEFKLGHFGKKAIIQPISHHHHCTFLLCKTVDHRTVQHMTIRYLLRPQSLHILRNCRVSIHLHNSSMTMNRAPSCCTAHCAQTWCARPLCIQPLVQLRGSPASSPAACSATGWGCSASVRHHSHYVAARALAAAEQQAAAAEAATSVAALAGRAQQARASVVDIVQARFPRPRTE